MIFRNDKIMISTTNMNRIYHGTKKIWEVLEIEGARLLTAQRVVGRDGKTQTFVERVPLGERPKGEVVGIDIMSEKKRFLTDWRHKFIATNPIAGEGFKLKEIHVNSFPTIAVDPRR